VNRHCEAAESRRRNLARLVHAQVKRDSFGSLRLPRNDMLLEIFLE